MPPTSPVNQVSAATPHTASDESSLATEKISKPRPTIPSEHQQSCFQQANDLLRALTAIKAIDDRRRPAIDAGIEDTSHLIAEYSFGRIGFPLATTYGNTKAGDSERTALITQAAQLIETSGAEIANQVCNALESGDANLISSAQKLRSLAQSVLDIDITPAVDDPDEVAAAG